MITQGHRLFSFLVQVMYQEHPQCEQHIMWFFFFLKIYLFIGKSDMQSGGETGRKIFHLMIHSPRECNGWCYADPKPEFRNFFRVSNAGAGSHGFGSSWTAFPGHKQGAKWEMEL